MNKTKIEWCDYTTNPVKGKCPNACWYCYARRMYDRFKWNPKIRFKPEVLDKIKNIKKPSKIFVGSTHDLFGEWVPKEWIDKIIKVAVDNPKQTFQFLTKNPQRYLEFKFPKNCWLGFTIDKIKNDTNTKVNLMKIKSFDGNYTFISFEPLLDDPFQLFIGGVGESMKKMDLVIIGAMTGPGAIKPKKEWIDSIKHKNVFYKNNIKKYL